jgi:hypothetical protein
MACVVRYLDKPFEDYLVEIAPSFAELLRRLSRSAGSADEAPGVHPG